MGRSALPVRDGRAEYSAAWEANRAALLSKGKERQGWRDVS